MKAISVLLIEDSALFRSALETVLRRAGFLVTTCTSKTTPARHSRHTCVVLFDVVTFAGGPNEIEAIVQQWTPLARVLLLGRADRLEQLLVGLRAGAAGCLKQTASANELRRAVVSLAAGGSWYERTLGELLLEYSLPPSSRAKPRLTKREAEVLAHLVQGKRNKEIAESLGLTEQTIKIQVSNLLRKTGTSNRTSLLLYAMRRGLVPA